MHIVEGFILFTWEKSVMRTNFMHYLVQSTTAVARQLKWQMALNWQGSREPELAVVVSQMDLSRFTEALKSDTETRFGVWCWHQ
jgi:hypothetical protein